MSEPLPDWKTISKDQRAEAVRNLAVEGFSCSMIAARFQNASRNAVIGLLRRVEEKDGIRIPRRRTTTVASVKRAARIAAPKPVKVVKPAKPVKAEKTQQAEIAATPAAPKPSRANPYAPLDGVNPVAIIDLPLRLRCRWPVDVAGQDLHFACGAATVTDDHSYCATHRALSGRGVSQQGAI